jgi:PKD repeat protein
VVQVLDAANNPIVGRAVAWVIGEGGGSVNPETSTTDGEGKASTQWTLGSAPGRNTVSAVVSGVGVAGFNATAGKASSTVAISSHQPEPSAPGQAVEVQVQVTGSGGTPSGTVTVTGDGAAPCTITLAGGTGACSLTFGSPGNRSITATYGGDAVFNGNSAEVTHRVEVANAAPTAAFSPPSCTAGQPCQFTDGSSDSDGNVVAWAWTFGGGGSSNEQNPSHVFGAAGSFPVTLAVTDDKGATNSVTHDVSVAAAPNSPPVAMDDAFTTDEGESLTVDPPGVLANDSDPEGGPITAALASFPSAGLVDLRPDGSFTYFPGLAPEGSQDSFTYTVSDGTLTSTATVTITID